MLVAPADTVLCCGGFSISSGSWIIAAPEEIWGSGVALWSVSRTYKIGRLRWFKQQIAVMKQFHIVTCMSDYRWGLDWWLDLLLTTYTQLVTTSNYNSLTGLPTLKITVTTAHVYILSVWQISHNFTKL
jgi:hypothetical protein